MLWSPPRHLLLDRAQASLRVEAAKVKGAGSGQGVVIGIIDAGVEVSHADLRHADGTTRVAWWLDFSSNPAGIHPALESAYGCEPEAGLRCQILSGADLDARLQNAVTGDEPRDPIGHGTHIASIAAGNGLWGGGSGFVGIAPEATLIASRVTGASGAIADSDVVLATQFVFDRASELGMPAVVNLSLGSDFGAHDGSSELSQVLAGFVGPDNPGRAIVVAGGNSGELHYGTTGPTSGPFGIHREVSVRSGATLEVPLLTPYAPQGGDTTNASLFVWISLYPAGTLSVGVELPDGTRLDPVGQGRIESVESGDLVAAVIHGVGHDDGSAALAAELPDLNLDDVFPSAGAAVILIDGQWPAGEGFSIQIEGEGRAELWVQSEGDLAPEAGSGGAVFSGATARQTVTIPASHPALIAVGASINRLEWTDYTGANASVEAFPATPSPELGAAAFFSSAGPNARGDFKPDVLAPGGFVIAALAAAADPRRGAPSIFSGGLCAGAGCQIVSDGYAVTAGTSMAAPMVSGAAALLLERDPTLTSDELRGLLIAGSSPTPSPSDLASREGGGVLDVAGSIDALLAMPRSSLELPDPVQSRLRFSGGSALRDVSRSLVALLWLRDGAGGIFDAAIERLQAKVVGGELSQSIERTAPGLYQFRVAASARAESALSIEVLLDGQAFLIGRLPLEQSSPTRGGSSGGGCSSAPASSTSGAGAVLYPSLLVLGTLMLRRRRAASATVAFKARSSTR